MPKRAGRKSKAQTPAPPSERIVGSKKNPKGSAASEKSASKIKLNEKTLTALKNKLSEFKKEHPNKKNITLNDLKAVYRRGAGAYSKSHRPTITGGVPNSRNAWSMARVNKFLKKAGGEKVKAAYVQDDDLMKMKDGGSTLLAPNGEPSNLTPKQYKLVRTPQFKAWFGDWENDPQNASKVVDENGEPLVVYHGTDSKHNVFSYEQYGRTDFGYWGKGIYFTQDEDMAYSYGQRILNVFLNLRNPCITTGSPLEFINSLGLLSEEDYEYYKEKYEDENENIWEDYATEGIEFTTREFANRIQSRLINLGYDGVLAFDEKEYISFNSNQIKLADGSNTTFDSSNLDIRYEKGGVVAKYIKNIQVIGDDEEGILYSGSYGNSGVLTWINYGEVINVITIESGNKKGSSGTMAIASLFLLNPKVQTITYQDNSHFEDGTSFWVRIGGDDTDLERSNFFNYFQNKFGYNPDIRFAKGGSTLLAPNGEPSNLTPRQYNLVRTPQFKAWFGDWENDPKNASKVVDENGEPLVVYRGVKGLYDYKKSGNQFFTPDLSYAKAFGYNVVSCFLNIRDLLDLEYYNKIIKEKKYETPFGDRLFQMGDAFLNENKNYWYENQVSVLEFDDAELAGEIFDRLKEVDGIVGIEAGFREIKSYLVWNPNQIKLADGSNTTFDSDSNDIRYEKGGLLAPNGKKSLLTEEQWHLVRTQEFKAWFGDWENDPQNASKVVDENGEPLVCYHGTDVKFNQFDKSNIGFGSGEENEKNGFYFTSNYSIAKGYADDYTNKGEYRESIVLACFLSIKNALILETIRGGVVETVVKNYDKYDGIIIEKVRDFGGISDQIIAFEPEQIKLADGSNTTFDKNNMDIRYVEGGRVGGFEDLEDEWLSKKIEIFLDKAKPYKFYFVDPKTNSLIVGFDEYVTQEHLEKVYLEATSSKEFFHGNSVEATYNKETGDTIFRIKLRKKVEYYHGGDIYDDRYIDLAPNSLVHKILWDEGYSINVKDRYILSHEKEISFRDKDQEQDTNASKPKGLWYSFGYEWANWVSREMPERANSYDYIHKINVTNKVLKLETIEQCLEFTDRFGSDASWHRHYLINWDKVAKVYSGIEVTNPRDFHLDEERIGGAKLWWLYGWDVGSGCIWKEDGIESIELVYGNEYAKGGEVDEKVIKERWAKKKDSLMNMADNIRSLRTNLRKDLKSENDKDRLTALAISLMDKTAERVGNDESEANGHLGITGLSKRNVKVEGNTITLKYVGKSGVKHEKQFSDEGIANALKDAIANSQSKYVFETSDGFRIKNDRVNRYLSEYDISAKDLRGYSANQWIVSKLREVKDKEILGDEAKRKKKFNEIVKSVAEKVGHGAPTLKKHYMLPSLEREWVNHGRIVDLSNIKRAFKRGGDVGVGDVNQGTSVINNIDYDHLDESQDIPGDGEGIFKKGGEVTFNNVIVYHEKDGNWFVPKNTIYAWLYDDPNAGEKLSSGDYEYVLFPPTPPLGASLQRGFVPPLLKIWTKKYQKSTKGSDKLIGIVKAWYDEKNKKLYVIMMTTRKDWRRKGVNSHIVQALREMFNLNKDQIVFDKPTKEGEKFMESGKYEQGGNIPKYRFIGEHLESDEVESYFDSDWEKIYSWDEGEGRGLSNYTIYYNGDKYLIEMEFYGFDGYITRYAYVELEDGEEYSGGGNCEYYLIDVDENIEYAKGGDVATIEATMSKNEIYLDYGNKGYLIMENIPYSTFHVNHFSDQKAVINELKKYGIDKGERVWSIKIVSVSPKYRGQGVASTLMAAAIQLAKQKNFKKLVLFVDPQGKGGLNYSQLHEFYSRYKFKDLKKMIGLTWMARKLAKGGELEKEKYINDYLENLGLNKPNISNKFRRYHKKLASREYEKERIKGLPYRKYQVTYRIPFGAIHSDIIMARTSNEVKTEFRKRHGRDVQGNLDKIISVRLIKDKKLAKGGELSDENKKEIYKKWKSLINMSKSELEKFYNSEEGKVAGLTPQQAKSQGIDSGRESARWIMKMKSTSVKDWTPTMWKWAKKQISFVSRMSGNKGPLYDEKGNKTRKHTSLLIWGHNPKKKAQGGEIESQLNNLNMNEVTYNQLPAINDLGVGKKFVLKEHFYDNEGGKPTHRGCRYLIVENMGDAQMADCLKLKVHHAFGGGGVTTRGIITRPIKNIMNKGREMGESLASGVEKAFKKGGELDPDKKEVKEYFEHKSGAAGGLLVGKRHSEGGIQAINKSTGQPLEMEGGEVVITRDAVSDSTLHDFNGKQMTNREILSAINESGGGVKFADGGDVSCKCSGKEYKLGGKTYKDYELFNKINNGYGSTSAIKKGMEVEDKEHGETFKLLKNGEITYEQFLKKLVVDHLSENPKYYDK